MPTPAVLFTVRLTARDEDLRREIAALLGPVAAQPGCLRCVVLHDALAAEQLVVIQEWATRGDLERHLRSEECRRLLLMAELSSAAPEFSIDTVASREGLEAIGRARCVANSVPSLVSSSTQGGETS